MGNPQTLVLASSSGADVWTAVATSVLALTAVAALLIAPRQIAEARRARRAQILSTLATGWASPEMRSARLRLSQIGTSDELFNTLMAAREERTDEVLMILTLPMFFETLAVLVDAEAVEYEHLKRVYGSDIRGQWKLWKKSIITLREDQRQPSMYEEFQTLAERLEADELQRR
jgi:hypothetical protein